MQQVAEWLEKLGLGQYAQRFAENDMDFALFTKLTDVDLKELGVASLGHRKLLLEAIAERAAAVLPNVAEPKPPQDTAERRHVTVMFSDLVGSTASRRAWTRRTCARSFPLIEVRRRDCPALRRLRGEVYGRWGARVFGYPMRTKMMPSGPYRRDCK